MGVGGDAAGVFLPVRRCRMSWRLFLGPSQDPKSRWCTLGHDIIAKELVHLGRSLFKRPSSPWNQHTTHLLKEVDDVYSYFQNDRALFVSSRFTIPAYLCLYSTANFA
jgi:hypothetical protein